MVVYLSLGSNLGDRVNLIEQALSQLASYTEISILEISSFIETEPFGFHRQPYFINCTAKIETDLDANKLLIICQSIEAALGRKRELKWGPRTIDIDILFYGEDIIENENLLIPHPGIKNRKYLLQSLQELCPDFIHPLLNRTIRDLYRFIDD